MSTRGWLRMTASFRAALPAAFLLLEGCAVSRGEPILSPAKLNADPSLYHGRTVNVRGALYYSGSHGHVLYESRGLHDEMRSRWQSDDPEFDPRDYAKYCLTIANPGRLRTSLTGRLITVRGRFIKDYLDGQTIDFGACILPTAIVIKWVE